MSTRVNRAMQRTVLNLVLAAISLLFFVPMLYMFTTAVKYPHETYANPGLIPHSFVLDNFSTAWKTAKMLSLGINSLAITVATVLLVLLLGSMAAYAFARLRPFASGFLLLLFLSGLMMPFASLIVPIYVLNVRIGLVNTYLAVVGPYVALGLPFCILLLRNYFYTVPREIEESARIDGASNLRIYWQISLPLIRPALATVAIFQALGTWNEFLLAMINLTKQSVRTLPLGIAIFGRPELQEVEVQCAMLVIITLPIVVLFLTMQRQFISGLAAGALK